jgi:hypothetical protein
MAEREDWPQIERALEILAPLMVEVDATDPSEPGRAFESAVQTRDADQVRATTVTFVVAAVSALVARAAREASAPSRRETIRIAFAELISISPALKQTAFGLHQQIEVTFRRAYSDAAGDSERFATTSESLLSLLAEVGGLDD